MLAKIFVIPQSFEANLTFSIEDIEAKIESLAIDHALIKQNKEANEFFVHDETYQVEFLNGVKLFELLFDPSQGKQYIGRDAYNALQKIAFESPNAVESVDTIVNTLLHSMNEHVCHAVVCFREVPTMPLSHQLVYGAPAWMHFRRYVLGVYPGNGTFFIDECKNYFPALYFHERNKNSISQILGECPKKILYHLAALNDKFRDSQQVNFNRQQVLQHFSVQAALDETASLEGDASRKPALTFAFENEAKEPEAVCCELHLKLCYNDAYPGDKSYSTDRRIYFHEGRSTIQNGKILIGHIGRHL